MNIITVKDLVDQQLKRSGYKYQIRESTSTTSVYFKIYASNTNLLFRIADHKTKKDIITLRIDHKTSQQSIQRFVQNRIDDVKKRNLKIILGI